MFITSGPRDLYIDLKKELVLPFEEIDDLHLLPQVFVATVWLCIHRFTITLFG
jgi:hypothetical protein